MTLFFWYTEYLEYSVFQISQNYKRWNILPFAGPYQIAHGNGVKHIGEIGRLRLKFALFLPHLSIHHNGVKAIWGFILMPAFNFINVLYACFLYEILAPKISNPKHSFVIFGTKILHENSHVKLWWNWLLVNCAPDTDPWQQTKWW